MPLAPLHSDSIRPAESGVRRCLLGRAAKRLQGVQEIVGWVTRSLPTDSCRQNSIPTAAWIVVENASQFSTLRSLPAIDVLCCCRCSKTSRRLGPDPLQEAERRCCAGGARGMDAERGAMGQGCPFATTPGAAPEGGEFCEAKPGCRGGLLFGYFFLATQEKVTRPAGRNQSISQPGQSG